MSREQKTTCAPKCYKLDRTRNLCERYKQTVERTGPNQFQKCDKCLEETKNGGGKL